MSTSPLSKTYAYQSSWNWVALTVIRGSLSALLLMGLLLMIGQQSAAPSHPWGYALRMALPLGLITVFPTVSIELWGVQRKMSWWMLWLLTYLSVMGSWSLALLTSNIVNQAYTSGYSAIGLWLRYQFVQLLQHPSLWLGVLFPPLLFATATVFRVSFPRRQGLIILAGLLVGNAVFWMVRPGNPSPIRGFFFLLALVIYAHRVSDNLLSLLWPYHRLWPRDHSSYTLPLSKRPPLWVILLTGGRDIVTWLQFNFLVGFVTWMLTSTSVAFYLYIVWLALHLTLSMTLPLLFVRIDMIQKAHELAEYRLTSPWHTQWERSVLHRSMQIRMEDVT